MDSKQGNQDQLQLSNQKSSPDRKTDQTHQGEGQQSKTRKMNNEDIVQEDDEEEEELDDVLGVLPKTVLNQQGHHPGDKDKSLLPSASNLANYSASIQALG